MIDPQGTAAEPTQGFTSVGRIVSWGSWVVAGGPTTASFIVAVVLAGIEGVVAV
jgi:hypothetical protein